LRTLAGLERKKIEDELNELKKMIIEFKAILADENRILEIIKAELNEIKDRFGDKRRTKIINKELGKMSDEDLIPNEQVVVTLTAGNYIKRSPISEYRMQGRGGKGRRGMITKEEDIIEELILANTHDELLFFTNKGRVLKLKTYEVPAVGLNARGIAVVNLLQLQPEETVSSIVKMNDKLVDSKGFLFMCTRKGTVKKTSLDKYQNIRTSGIIAINLDDDDELKWIRTTYGEDEIIISTMLGQSIRFAEENVRPMGRSARGVRGIRLREGDQVIGMNVAEADAFIFVISENGYGKRTRVKQFTAHRRGGVGIKAAIVNKKTGNLVGVHSLKEGADEVIVISKQGQVIRLSLKDISIMGRTTQGVRIMRLNNDDYVASVGLIQQPPENDKPEEKKSVEKKPAGKKPKAKK